jgi:hypothetical protein
MHVPESFLQQFFYPFILVARSLGLAHVHSRPATPPRAEPGGAGGPRR